MRTTVTGGAGFIGSHLVELLLSLGHEVRVVDNLSKGQLDNLHEVRNHPRLSLYEVDIRDKKGLEEPLRGTQWVFHLAALAAALPSIERPLDYFDVNVQGTLNVLEAAKCASVDRFIYAASSSCYGEPQVLPTPETASISPLSPYALTKYMGEELVLHWHKMYGMGALSLRLFNVYGPRSCSDGNGGAVFGVFLGQKDHGQPLTVIGDGLQRRDFIFATDVANAFYLAAKSDLSGEAFNVGGGDAQTISYLTSLLQSDVVYLPPRPNEATNSEADISKIKEKLGWRPMVTFEEGVQRTLNRP